MTDEASTPVRTPAAGSRPRARSQPRPASIEPWGKAPDPPLLVLAPGGSGVEGREALGVLILGLDGDGLEQAVREVERQRVAGSVRPVVLSDCPDLGSLIGHGYAVEYLPAEPGTETDAAIRRQDRIRRLLNKWNIGRLIGRWPGQAGLMELTPHQALATATIRRWASERNAVSDGAGMPEARAPSPAREDTLARQQLAGHPGGGRTRAEAERPQISYCIPVMNRGADLRATLEHNLRENLRFGDRVEFIVMFFDRDHATQHWIRQRFGRELARGLLRVVRSNALDEWHFGRAKNAFRPLIRGLIYSSLDADNFVTAAETQQLIDVGTIHGEGFVFHHFSGQWGDGSSGRVSLPAALFQRVGYNEQFLPRQFDEIDLILSALKTAPSAALICHHVEHNFITMSERTRQFVRQEGLRNPFVRVPPAPKRPPLNPKPVGYVGRDESLRAMTEFNQAMSFIANGTSPERRDRYTEWAHAARQRLADLMSGEALVRMLFEPDQDTLSVPRPHPDEVCLFACVKDDHRFLRRFLDHYRRLGVTRFFLVDDHSSPPLRDGLTGPDVHVVVPRVGTFLTAKGLWLEALMRAHLEPGAWALTVDADEFVDLPSGCADFPALARLAAAQGRDWLSGLLIDMLPATPDRLLDLDRDPEAFEDALSHCCAMREEPSRDYLAHPSVRWGFGEHAGLSWTVDARFHAFGTFDSLRKIPFLRHRSGLHLNQGFHTLHYTDGTRPLSADLWSGGLVLPIRHYKLSKLLSGAAREHLSLQVRTSGALQYHSRSAANISRILSQDAQQIDKLLRLPSRPYSEGTVEALGLGGPEAAPWTRSMLLNTEGGVACANMV